MHADEANELLPSGFPRNYARMTPAARSAWLRGEQCAQLLRQRRLRAAQVRAEARRLKKEADRVAVAACSPCRTEEFLRGYAFPPPAENTPMRQASHVLHESEMPMLWPAHYLSGTGATYDVIVYETEARRLAIELKVQRGESSSSSPSAEAVAAAAAAGAVLPTGVPLLTEDEQVLREQIDRYLAGKKTSLLPDQE